MNKTPAKLMSFVGILCCLSGLILLTFIFVDKGDLPIFIPFLLLIAGILIVIFSLAYYTEK